MSSTETLQFSPYERGLMHKALVGFSMRSADPNKTGEDLHNYWSGIQAMFELEGFTASRFLGLRGVIQAEREARLYGENMELQHE